MPKNSNNEVKYAVNDLKEIVDIFLSKTEDNGRYLSYEYCFNYFNKHYKTTNNKKLNQMTIYLYTYLASWGMLRNSFLLYKDPFFNRGIVELLCKTKIESKKNKNQ